MIFYGQEAGNAMAKALKIIGIIVLVLILLIGAGIVAIIHFVDPNNLKTEINSAVYKQTGRHLTIQGDLSWSFFPWVGFKVNNIQLSNAEGFTAKPFATAKKVDISVRLMPLLTGSIDVNNIELDSLQVNLSKNAQGISNWSGLATAHTTAAANTPSSTSPEPAKSPLNLDFSIANLTIVNGQISWDDQQKNQQYTISKIYIAGSNIGTQDVFPLTISATIASKQLPKPINFSIDGQYNIPADLTSVALNQLDIKLDSLELQGDFSAKELQTNPSFQGDLHVTPLNLTSFLNDFNIKLPAMQNKQALQNISADIAFNGNSHLISLKPFNLDLDGSKLTGNINIKNLSDPSVNFKFDVDQLNIDDYMAPKAEQNTTADNKAKPSNSSSTTADTPINLPINLLRSLNMQGSVQLSQLVVSNLHLSNVNVSLNAAKGNISLNPINLNLYEGSASATTSLNVAGPTPRYNFTLNATKIQAEPFINDLISKDFITGTANLSANLSTNGTTVNTLINRLDGNSKFNFSNGMLKGVNVEHQLASAKALLKKQSPPSAPTNKTTPFGNITGTININNGVATNNNLLITSPAFTGKGTGTANLNNKKINYQLNITTKKINELKNYRIPLTISGALTSPSINLDTNDILQQIVSQQKQAFVNKAKQDANKQVTNQVHKYIKNKDVSKALGNLFG